MDGMDLQVRWSIEHLTNGAKNLNAFIEALAHLKTICELCQESKSYIPQISGKALRGCYGAVNSFLRRKVTPAYQDGKGHVQDR